MEAGLDGRKAVLAESDAPSGAGCDVYAIENSYFFP